jgi:hypothetical protein
VARLRTPGPIGLLRRKPFLKRLAVFENSTACASAIELRSWCASRFDPPPGGINSLPEADKSQVEKYPVMVWNPRV